MYLQLITSTPPLALVSTRIGGGNSVKRFLKGLSLGNKHASTGGSSTGSHPHSAQRTHVPRINFSPGGLAQAQGLGQPPPAPGQSQQGQGLGHGHGHDNGPQAIKHNNNFASTNSTLSQVDHECLLQHRLS